MENKTKVIVIHETVLQSYLIDTSTLFLFVSLIGIGVYLESTAMQWVGAIVGFFTLGGRISRNGRKTIAEARKFLDDLEAGRA